MKRKIAILLATTMTLTAVPALAAKTVAPSLEGSVSTVSTGAPVSTLPADYAKDPATITMSNKTAAVAYQEALRKRESVLKIGVDRLSTADIKKGDKFTIKLENGKFRAMGQDPEKYAYRNVLVGGDEQPKNVYVKDGKVYIGNQAITYADTDLATLLNTIQFATTNNVTETGNGGIDTVDKAAKAVAALPHIPYSINVLNDTTAEITFLSDITDLNITKDDQKVASYYEYNLSKVDRKGKVASYLAIPLGDVECTGGEELKVSVMGFSDTITNGTVTLAKTVGTGSTYIDKTYITKQVFEYDLVPSDLYVRENTKNSFENNGTVTIRLNNGFEFADDVNAIKAVNAATNASLIDGTATITDKTRISFKLKDTSASDRETVKISLPKVRATNEDKNYGEVSLSISGAGITNETVVIGERSKLGFKLETKTEVPTITKGRYVDLNSNVDSKESYTAEFEFSESVPGSLLSSRNLDFTVPAGVKIADAEVVGSPTGISYESFNKAFSIINDGTTLRLERDNYTIKTKGTTSTAKLRLKLKLSVDAGFTGEEVKLTVSGGGISENLQAVIAKVQNPFTITAKPKNINIGYQDYSVNDIVITENKPGMFMEGENLLLSIKAPYGTDQMGFTNAKVAVTGGNLEVKSVGSQYINGNQIAVNIKTQSTKEPATITISDVKIGTTRSVPFGAYNLEIGGRAVINNDLVDSTDKAINGVDIAKEAKKLNFKLDNPAGTADKDNLDKAKRVDASNGSYKVDAYVNVVTATDTIDKEMKVTIGSTTAMIGNQEVTMDVAPYIQANGNTMVPLRFVSVALAGGDATSVESAQNSDKVSWDAASKTVTIFYGAGINQKIIQFKIGSTNMVVDGNTVPMGNGAKAEIKNGRTFVPFRSLGQALGVPVNWDATTKTAVFNQN